MPTADTIAHVKTAGAAIGTHAKRSRSSAATMVGFSSWIQRNWRDAQTPMMKEVSAQRSNARTVSGSEAAAAEERDAEKKNATSAASSAAHTVKKAPCRSRSASRRYAPASPTVRTANTGSPPRSRRKTAAGASAAAMRALWTKPEGEADAAARTPAVEAEEPDEWGLEVGEGKGRRGLGEEVELRRSWCGERDEDGARVEEKVGVESDGEMGRRPWLELDPDRSMGVAASTEDGI